MTKLRRHTVIPGFRLTLGYSVSYLSLIVLIPLSALVARGVGQPFSEFRAAVFDPRTLAAWRLTFGTTLAASLVNAVFGLIVAWTLVRYDFPGRKLLDTLIDLPFALPTAVSGIALTAIYAPNGWVGRWLEALGIKAAYTPFGIVIALSLSASRSSCAPFSPPLKTSIRPSKRRRPSWVHRVSPRSAA